MTVNDAVEKVSSWWRDQAWKILAVMIPVLLYIASEFISDTKSISVLEARVADLSSTINQAADEARRNIESIHTAEATQSAQLQALSEQVVALRSIVLLHFHADTDIVGPNR